MVSYPRQAATPSVDDRVANQFSTLLYFLHKMMMMNDYDYDEDYGTAADDHDSVAKLFSTPVYFLHKEEKIKW